MKSNIISVCCFFFSLAQIMAQSSQATRLVFQPMTLTGGNAKIIPAGFRPYFQLELTGGVFLNNPTDANQQAANGMGQLQNTVFSSPELFEQLFQKLGGEFFIGNFSDPSQPGKVFKNQSPSLGLNIGLRLLPHLKIEAGASRSSSEFGAAFPVVVFGQQNGQPQTLQGNLRTEQQHLLAQFGGAWFLGKSTFQPFLGAGVQYARTAASTMQAELADTRFPVAKNSAGCSFGAYGTAGVEVHPSFPLYCRAAVNVRTEKLPPTGEEVGGDITLRPSVLAGIGWRF
ncbi:MAG: hypothetical protein K9J37_06725 [Saprospiraceae bacterium]|nr:hypothetical protein [Saprospiraceae bacterium]MCF8249588.1 hypothetical protein [Saprospiraceae bacterium]MCF8280488.1 hypothetical protein [Bacteroidales bacterium]MCF8310420.1 hypothetical protein [Saprospiraceae bacterium]MCF8439798.1 hypothetical protein [Saprospiraceae bacterium]